MSLENERKAVNHHDQTTDRTWEERRGEGLFWVNITGWHTGHPISDYILTRLRKEEEHLPSFSSQPPLSDQGWGRINTQSLE